MSRWGALRIAVSVGIAHGAILDHGLADGGAPNQMTTLALLDTLRAMPLWRRYRLLVWLSTHPLDREHAAQMPRWMGRAVADAFAPTKERETP